MKIDLDERELTYIKNALRDYSMHRLQHAGELRREELAHGQDTGMSELVFSEHDEIGMLRTKIDAARK